MSHPAPASAGADARAPAPAAAPVPPVPPLPPGKPPKPEPLLKQVAGLLGELPLLFSDRVNLLALELRRAGLALGQIVGLVIGSAVLLATAWLALWAGLAAALLQHGVAIGWVMLIVIGINLGGAMICVARVKALAPLLRLPATLRHLTLHPARSVGRPETPPEATSDAARRAAAQAAAQAVAAASAASAAAANTAATPTTSPQPPAAKEASHVRAD